MLQVACTSCGQAVLVQQAALGQQTRCPRCRNFFVAQAVPSATASPAASRSGIFPAPRAVANQPGLPPLPGANRPDAWYLNQADGKSFGPIPKAQLDGWVLQGMVGAADFVLQQGDQQWRTAGEVYPLLASAAKAPPASGNAFAGFDVGSSSGGIVSSSSGSKHKRPHRGPLILTLALVGWFACGLCCIAAWVMGAEDLKLMRMGRMDRSGEGMTTFGMFAGMIGTILMGAGVLIGILVIVLAAGSAPR